MKIQFYLNLKFENLQIHVSMVLRCTIPRNLRYLLIFLFFKPNYIFFTKAEIQDKYIRKRLKRGGKRGDVPPPGKISGLMKRVQEPFSPLILILKDLKKKPAAPLIQSKWSYLIINTKRGQPLFPHPQPCQGFDRKTTKNPL